MGLKFPHPIILCPSIWSLSVRGQTYKSILIELSDEGWKFTCENFNINIDNGLYFGNKNTYSENQNIFISGISNNQTENIKWEINKI